jgi:KipI family sensor histidine kinase inhibitor
MAHHVPSPSSARTAAPSPEPVLEPPLALHPVGERGLLADYPDTAHVLAAADAIRALGPDHLVDVVPAERTLLLLGAEGTDREGLAALLSQLPPSPSDARSTREVTIDAVYDGEDLADVADLLGLSTDALVDAHTTTRWTAAFGGFAPGFSYLVPVTDSVTAGTPGDSGTPPWDVPRRSAPRSRVPQGSIALASRYCGVYPTPSPGGWQLIGHTGATLWDSHLPDPALITPGSRVRFRSVRASARASARVRTTGTTPGRRGVSRPDRATSPQSRGVAAFTVLSPGPSTVVQDAGRPGHAALGVSSSGAADRSGMVRANLAVGNRPHAPILEILLGPLRLRADRELVLALDDGARGQTEPPGAPMPSPLPVLVHGAADGIERSYAAGAPFPVSPGDTVTIGPAGHALRLSLAVRGGVTGPDALMGSWSRDVLGGLGPAPLAEGDVVQAGPTDGLGAIQTLPPPARGDGEPDADPESDGTAQSDTGPAGADGPVLLPLLAGPRDALLGREAMDLLLASVWTVRQDSDRVGVRLDGPTVPVPDGAGSLPSEGMVPGAVQIPPSGLPVVFGRDHPTTGGYPVIGVVTDAGLDLLAHAAPARTVRFVLLG